MISDMMVGAGLSGSVEFVVLIIVFVAGFIFFDAGPVRGMFSQDRRKKGQELASKQLASHFASGKNDEALEAFAALEEVTVDDVASGVGACVELGQGLDGIVKLLTPRLAALKSRHGLALAALQALQGTGALSLFADWLQGQGVPLDAAAREVLVRGLADQGTSVERWLDGERMSASTYRALVEAAFARKDWRQGKVLLEAMVRAGLYVPAHLTTQLLRLVAAEGDLEAALGLLGSFPVAGEALTTVLAACEERLAERGGRQQDAQTLLERVVDLATQRQVPMLYSSYEALVKAWARLRDGRAKRSFDEMATRCCVPTDATCLQILAACVPAGNLDVARHVLTYLRRTRKAPVQAFETACATAAEAQAWSACLQIGQDLTADGLVASAELKEILRRAQQHIDSAAIAPVPDTAPRGKGKGKGRGKGSGSLAGFMASVRECGRSKDAARALQLLQELRASGERPDTIACNAVLDVVVKAGNLGAARALLEEMKAARLIDAASFNSMLNARGARTPLSVKEVDAVLDEMRQSNVKPTLVSYNAAINAAVVRQDQTAAWRYVSELQKAGLRPDAFTCSILLKGLKDVKTAEEVDRVLALLETRTDVHADDVLSGALLDATVKLKDGPRLGKALAQVRSAGILPTGHAYGTVLRALAQGASGGDTRARWAEAQKVWREMHARQVTPTEDSYQALVDCAVACGDTEAALSAVAELQASESGPRPTAGIYASAIRGLVLDRQMDRAEQLYQELKAEKLPIGLVTYNALVDAMSRVGDVDRAADLFRDMCAQGLSPDLVTYSTVIKGYCVQGDLEQAIQLFTLMRKRGIQPDAILFNSILDGAARKQMTSLVEQVLGDMEGCGIAPSNFTLSILVKLYGRSQDLDTALRHVETMPAKYGFVANDQVYTCLVAACANCGRMAQAYEVFRKLASPDAKAFTTVINGALKHNDVSGALQFLERGVAARCGLGQDVVDNVTFMAQRRKLSSQLQTLAPKLATAGYTTRSRAVDEPEAGVQSRVQERRGKAQSWRDIVARE